MENSIQDEVLFAGAVGFSLQAAAAAAAMLAQEGPQ